MFRRRVTRSGDARAAGDGARFTFLTTKRTTGPTRGKLRTPYALQASLSPLIKLGVKPSQADPGTLVLQCKALSKALDKPRP